MYESEMTAMKRLEALYAIACDTDLDEVWAAYWELLEQIDRRVMRQDQAA